MWDYISCVLAYFWLLTSQVWSLSLQYLCYNEAVRQKQGYINPKKKCRQRDRCGVYPFRICAGSCLSILSVVRPVTSNKVFTNVTGHLNNLSGCDATRPLSIRFSPLKTMFLCNNSIKWWTRSAYKIRRRRGVITNTLYSSSQRPIPEKVIPMAQFLQTWQRGFMPGLERAIDEAGDV